MGPFGNQAASGQENLEKIWRILEIQKLFFRVYNGNIRNPYRRSINKPDGGRFPPIKVRLFYRGQKPSLLIKP